MKKGFFEAANLKLDVIYVQSSANLVQQLTAGSLDIVMSTGLVDPIRAIDQNARIAIIRFEAQAPPYALVGKASIKKLEGPQGKDHLGRRRQGHHPHLCRAHAGAARRQTRRIRHGVCGRNLGTGVRASGRRGRCGDPPATLQFPGQRAGFNELGLTIEYAPELPFSGTVVNQSWAAKNQDLLQRILGAHSKSVEWFYDR